MVETPGICIQTTMCEVARSGRIMTVPLGSPFVCPECERGLAPPVQSTDPVSVQKMPAAVPLALVGAGLLVLGGAVFLGRELAEGRVSPSAQVASESSKAVSAPVPSPAPTKLAMAAPALVATPAPRTMAPLLVLQTVAATDPKAAPVGKPAFKAADARPSSSAAAAPPVAAPITLMASKTATGSASPVAKGEPPAMAAAGLPAAASAPTARSPVVGAPAASVIATAMVAPPPPALPDQSFSAVPIAGGSPAYPAELAANGRPGRVNVSCQIAADGSPSGCHATAGKGGPAFAAATLAWFAHANVRYRPIILHGHAVAASRSWTLVIEEPASVLAEAKRKQQQMIRADAAKMAVATAAPEPAAPLAISLPVQPIIARQVIAASPRVATERPFSSHVLAGGAPVFPVAYDESRPGSVKVQCTIEEDGAASLCRVLKTVGGGAFGKSVETWLGSGRVRFRPVISGGQPVASEESWTVVFNSVPAPP